MSISIETVDKKTAIKGSIERYIEAIIELAEGQGSLDHFQIMINNHQGALQMDCTLRDREKAY